MSVEKAWAIRAMGSYVADLWFEDHFEDTPPGTAENEAVAYQKKHFHRGEVVPVAVVPWDDYQAMKDRIAELEQGDEA